MRCTVRPLARHPILLVAALTLLLPRPAASQTPPFRDELGDPLPPGAVARIGALRLRHAGEVYCLAFSPDGKTLASGGAGFHVRLWDAQTGKMLASDSPHGTMPIALDFSPDGKRLLSAEWGGRVVTWNVAAGKHDGGMRLGSSDATHACRFSADAARILTMQSTAGLVAWSLEGKQLASFPIFKSSHLKPAISPDGTLVLNNHEDHSIRVWDATTGKQVCLLGPHKQEVDIAVFCPKRKFIASAGRDNLIHLWDLAKAELARTLPDKAYQFAFSPDGKTLASSHRDGRVLLWDPLTGKMLRALEGHKTSISALAFSADGSRLAAGSGGGVIRVWDTATGKDALPVLGFESTPRVLAFSPDGRSLTLKTSEGLYLCGLKQPETPAAWKVKLKRVLPFDYAYGPCSLSADCSGFALAQKPRLTFWRLPEGKEAFTRVGEDLPFALCASPDGRWLAAATEAGVHLLSTRDGKPRHGAKPLIQGRSPAFTSDGLKLATLVTRIEEKETERSLAFWDVVTGKEERRFSIHRFPTPHCGLKDEFHLAFLPTGNTIAVLSAHLELWDLATGQQAHALPLIAPAAFSPDGRHVAGVGPKREVQLWELASGAVVAEWPGSDAYVNSLAFSPDGRLLASGRSDTTVLIWDVTLASRFTQPRASSKVDATALSRCWEELGAADGKVAREAAVRLTTDPGAALALLSEKLQPAPAVSREKIAGWIERLGSPVFREREEALGYLRTWRFVAWPRVKQALEDRPTLDKQRRLESLLRDLERREVLIASDEQRRFVRSVQLLEEIASPAAVEVLERLARGEPLADQTRAARAALRRVQR